MVHPNAKYDWTDEGYLVFRRKVKHQDVVFLCGALGEAYTVRVRDYKDGFTAYNVCLNIESVERWVVEVLAKFDVEIEERSDNPHEIELTLIEHDQFNGYRLAEIEEKLSAEEWKKFADWIYPQTVALISVNGGEEEGIVYKWDWEHYLRGGNDWWD